MGPCQAAPSVSSYAVGTPSAHSCSPGNARSAQTKTPPAHAPWDTGKISAGGRMSLGHHEQGCTVPVQPPPTMSHVTPKTAQDEVQASPLEHTHGPICPVAPPLVVYSPAHVMLTMPELPSPPHWVGDDGTQHNRGEGPPSLDCGPLSLMEGAPSPASGEGGPPHAPHAAARRTVSKRDRVFMSLNLDSSRPHVERVGRSLPHLPPTQTYMGSP